MQNPSNRKSYSWQGRVYFGDTDAAQVVYHGRYINWLEAARIDFLDEIGCSYASLQTQNTGLIPVDLNIHYHKPLKFGDRFTIKLWTQELTRASIIIANEIWLNDQHILTAEIRLACIDQKTWRPHKLPEIFIQKLKDFESL